MENFKRYAVYYAPRPGEFATAAAAWLGWDAAQGCAVPQPDLMPDLAEITAAPRKYGFHGTIRAPFRPGQGVTGAAIADAVAALATRVASAPCAGLRLANLHGFLALVPDGTPGAILRLGAAVVEGTDALRAPLSEGEIARRRPDRLSARQRSLLTRWGYPFVMEEFQFHLTLSDRLGAEQAETVGAVALAHLAPVLPRPFVIEDLCLFGEDDAGRFHLIHRYALTG